MIDTKKIISYVKRNDYFVPQIVALLIFAPLNWMVFDRTPSYQLHDGVILPAKARLASTVIAEATAAILPGRRSAAGYAVLGVALLDADGAPRIESDIIKDTVAAIDAIDDHDAKVRALGSVGGIAMVTWQARFSGHECEGNTQRELIGAQKDLWPQLGRARAGLYHANPTDPYNGTLTTPLLTIPDLIAPGQDVYHVTNFYYCNPLQRLLQWPIVSLSPDIKFTVTDE